MFNNWHKILENLTTGFCELVQADDRHHWSCQPQRPKVIRSTLHYVVNYLLLNKLFYLYARSQNMLYIIMNRILCHYKYITCLCTYNKPRKVFLAKNLRALSSLYNNWDSGHGIKLCWSKFWISHLLAGSSWTSYITSLDFNCLI